MIGPGKCDVVSSPFVNSAIARGLVVRVASIASTGGAAATTAGTTSVSDSATDVQLLSRDTSRMGWSVYNDSTQNLYITIGGATASTTNFSVIVLPGGYYEPPYINAYHQAEVRGIWAADTANGAARLTGYSA